MTVCADVMYEPAVRQVSLDVVTWESCLHAVENTDQPVAYKLTRNMFCAGGAAGHDACQVSSSIHPPDVRAGGAHPYPILALLLRH